MATHKGNFKEDFGIDVDCYVLNDDQKTATVSQRGMAVAIGLRERGSAFPSFANSKTMSPFVGSELRAKLQKPSLFFNGGPAAANSRKALFMDTT